MPLPKNGSLSLQGHSRPGGGISSNPKQAMLVRMSEETLEALQNLASGEGLEFEVGDSPGFYIHDVFYPMRVHHEQSNHELFIRTTTSVRPNGPLKLSANVAGRYVVDRDLSERLTKQIRDSSVAAAKLKSERHTIMLDAPPVAPIPKKRKVPPKSLQKSSLPINKSNNVYQRMTSPLPSQSSTPSTATSPYKGGDSSMRTRLIHFLALGPQSTSEAIKIIGGPEAEGAVREKIQNALADAAEREPPTKKVSQSSSDSQLWRLKAQTWLEVRPHQYAGYKDNERLAVARTARMWLSNMKIPEGTPAWEHVSYRASGVPAKPPIPATSTTSPAVANGIGTSAGASKRSDPKGGALTKEGKEKRAKTKPKPAADIKAKPEGEHSKPEEVSIRESGLRVSTAVAENGNGKEKEDGELSATPPRSLGPRTLPAVKAVVQTKARVQATPSPTPPGAAQVAPKKRAGPVDARGPKRELPAPSGSAKPAPPLPPPAPPEKAGKLLAKVPKKEKERVTSSSTPSRPPEKDGDRERGREKPTIGVKRKHLHNEGEDSDVADVIPGDGMKKKKGGERPSSAMGRSVSEKHLKVQDNSTQAKKPMRRESSPPRAKLKRSLSPLPPSKSMPSHSSKQSANSSEPSLGSRIPSNSKLEKKPAQANGNSIKPRRRSPKYTSSEDEDGAKANHAPSSEQVARRPRTPLPLPTDHAGLRARYSTAYVEYIATFQKVVAQKNKIEKMLNGSGGSSGGFTDSEGDVDMMSAEELEKLSAEHRSLQEELESIKRAWGR